MLPLFEHWPSIVRQLRGASTIALFLDFDGTLTHLQPRPEDVWPDGCVRHNLTLLARSRRFRVWIISGRRQRDVRNRVRVPGIRYLGLHGWEGRQGGSFLSEDAQRALASLLNNLTRPFAGISGIWIENKEFALTVHYRKAPLTGVMRARDLLHTALGPLARQLRILEGKCVWEILPRELEDKGAAVRKELAALSTSALPIYVGDDRVDEPAFSALPEGLTVCVGRRTESRARYRLAGVAQVRIFLDKLRNLPDPSASPSVTRTIFHHFHAPSERQVACTL